MWLPAAGAAHRRSTMDMRTEDSDDDLSYELPYSLFTNGGMHT